MTKTEEEVKKALTELLDECLESANQDQSFTVTNIDMGKMTFSVDFDIVIIEEDDYIGFQSY